MIVMIIITAGILTGVTNYLIGCSLKDPIRENWIKVFTSILLSLCASATVPLFLQILNNNLLQEPKDKELLIFLGFCVIAGFFARRFLNDLYAKVKNLENKVEEQDEKTEAGLAQNAKRTEEINRKVEDIEESNEEIIPEEILPSIKETLRFNTALNFEDDQLQKIINELSLPKYSWRTLPGIAQGTGISKEQLSPLFEHLKNFGFLEKRPRPVKGAIGGC
jgi:hypothetical protein